MTKKFTNGIWRYTESNGHISIHYGDEPEVEIDDKTIDQSICGIWIQKSDSRYCQSIANAKLIAAAPDLLEALESIVKFLTSNDGTMDTQLAINKGEAAIRKALD